MATFKDLQDRINLDYLNRTDFVQETKRAIIRAIKHYERARLWFNQTATATTITSASSTLALPADFIALDMVSYSNVQVTVPQLLIQRTYERVVYRSGAGTSATVLEECALFNNTLKIYPKPAVSSAIIVNYTMRLPVLSADTDNNAWCDEAEDLICYHAAADVLQNVIRGRPDDVAAMRDMESVALASLQRARNLHMNTNEDLSVLGPVHRQDPSKLDGSPPPSDTGKGV